MSATLPTIPTRMRMRAVIVDRRGGSSWAVGTGLLAFGMIDRDLTMHPTEAAADVAAIALADERDLLAVRS